MFFACKKESSMRLYIKKVFAAMLCLFVVFAVGCKTMRNVYSPEELIKIFRDAGGWTPLPFPDSKYRPGSIIKVTDDGIRWIDDLTACRYPQTLPSQRVGNLELVQSLTFKESLLARALIGYQKFDWKL